MKNVRNNERGFTLVELIVVIAVLGILSLILVPQFSLMGDKAMGTTAKADTKTIYSMALAHNMDNTEVMTLEDLTQYMGMILSKDTTLTLAHEGGVDASHSKYIYFNNRSSTNSIMYQYRRGDVTLTAHVNLASQQVTWGIKGITKTGNPNRWGAICQGLKIGVDDLVEIAAGNGPGDYGDPLVTILGP